MDKTVDSETIDLDLDLRGRVVIVTGASSGLGAWLASGLSAAGAHVVCTARRSDRLAEVAGALPGASIVAADLTRDDDRARIVQHALDVFGQIDGLVNNAGRLEVVPALRETAQALRDLLEVNLVAPMDLARRCAEVMRERRGGSIVNITSVSAIVATGATIPSAGYCAAKAGLAHATRELAVQWGRYGIRVNAVAPGMFPTEMVQGQLEPPDYYQERLVIRRMGRRSDILGAVHFLLSDAASYITGQQLAVDGGRSIT